MSRSLLDLPAGDCPDYTLADFAKSVPRWCPGCGDHSILTSMQRLLAEEGLAPEQSVMVSGIGCSSRFPHYMQTYGFHGLHGRALPVATGIKLERPDLHVFVIMGDGDCASIGAGHWIHATRYNTQMVALMLDNNVYGLTKNQTSPTTPQGHRTLTQPRGSYLPAINPISAALGVSNVSFVAQTAEWLPPHLFATLKAAYHHRGFAFVRVLQRCPKFTDGMFAPLIEHPDQVQLMVHEDGVTVPALERVYKNRVEHNPADLDAARRLSEPDGFTRLGVFYRNEDAAVYDEIRRVPAKTIDQKIRLLDEELDRHAI